MNGGQQKAESFWQMVTSAFDDPLALIAQGPKILEIYRRLYSDQEPGQEEIAKAQADLDDLARGEQ